MKNLLFSSLLTISYFASFSQLTGSSNGHEIPAHGDFRVLIIFVEIDWSDPSLNTGSIDWPQGQLPNFVNDWVHPTVVQGDMTEYYYEMSLGDFTFYGDYLNTLITVHANDFEQLGQIIPEQFVASFNNSYPEILAYNICRSAQNVSFSTGIDPSLGVGDFDLWNDPTPSNDGVERFPQPNSQFDHVMFVVRNSEASFGGTAPLDNTVIFVSGQNQQVSDLFGMGIDSWSLFNDFKLSTRTHETSHGLLGNNNFHSVGGQDKGQDVASYLIANQGGWGLMNSEGGSIKTCNAWDRYRLDWRVLNKNLAISCLNPLTATEQNTDLTVFPSLW